MEAVTRILSCLFLSTYSLAEAKSALLRSFTSTKAKYLRFDTIRSISPNLHRYPAASTLYFQRRRYWAATDSPHAPAKLFFPIEFLQKTHTVNGTGTICGQRLIMRLCAVTLMYIESVLRIFLGRLQHQVITGHLGQNRSRSNARAQAVPFNNGLDRNTEILGSIAINQCQFRSY